MQRIKLANGIRAVIENIPYLHSASIGVWVLAGSRYEKAEENGISHFIEHMLFKGTSKRSAKDIAAQIDNIGGVLNAFTAKECTCFYVHLIDEHINTGVELLSDMLFNSTFKAEEIKKEQGVVNEEISMVMDTPDDLVHELLSSVYFSGNSLSMPILGTSELVNSFNERKIRDYMERRYTADNIVISVAGNINEEDCRQMLEEHFGSRELAKCGKTDINAQIKRERKTASANRENEQMNMCLGFQGVGSEDKLYYAMSVFNGVFGGAMSSRLFQKIREQNGLTYSVYSYPSSYVDCGLFTIYAGMNPSQTERVISLVREEAELAKEKGLTDAELEAGIEQVKGSFILGLEGSRSIMNRNGKCMLLLNKITPVEEVLKGVASITGQDIKALACKIFDFENMCASFVGKQDAFPQWAK